MKSDYSPQEDPQIPSYPNRGSTGGEPDSVPKMTDPNRMVKVKMPDVIPIISYVLMGLTIVTFILQFGSEYLLGVDVLALAGAKVNELILQGQVWRFFTPMLLHGSILHLGFNMYALYIFGPGLERFYGRWRFLLLYILSGFAGNVMSFLFTSAPSLGSSTAIFGLLGAEGVFLYQNRSIFGRPAQRALGNIILIAVVNLMIGLSPGIDNWGHIGGLLAGTLFAWYAGPALQVEGSYPNLALVDRRSTSDVVRTALGVGVLFTSLAAVTIILRI